MVYNMDSKDIIFALDFSLKIKDLGFIINKATRINWYPKLIFFFFLL